MHKSIKYFAGTAAPCLALILVAPTSGIAQASSDAAADAAPKPEFKRKKVKKKPVKKKPINKKPVKFSKKRRPINKYRHTLGFTASSPGGLSPHSTGNRAHAIPSHLYPGPNASAHRYIASVDVINSEAPPEATGGLFNAQISERVPTPPGGGKLRLQVSGCNIGNDVQGTDWDIIGTEEWRIYKQCEFKLQYTRVISGTLTAFDLLKATGVSAKVRIDYKASNTHADDVLSTKTERSFTFQPVANTPNMPADIFDYKRDLRSALQNESVRFEVAPVVGPAVSASSIPRVDGYTVPYDEGRFTWVNGRP